MRVILVLVSVSLVIALVALNITRQHTTEKLVDTTFYVCDIARQNPADSTWKRACGQLQTNNNFEYLCKDQTCWVEVK